MLIPAIAPPPTGFFPAGQLARATFWVSEFVGLVA
jgi:hypothetical protein